MALHLPILGQCNIKCVFCSAVGRGGGFQTERLLEQISRDETGHVQISGGDPFLKEPLELLKILAHCKRLGKIVEFQTNAVLVPRYDAKRLKQIVGLVDYFNVNFSAHTPELDEAVTETPGAFALRLEGIRRLAALGAKLRLTYIVHGANFRYCEPFVAFVKERIPEASWIQFSYVKGMGRAKGDRRIIPRFKVAAPYLNDAMALCRKLGIRFEIDHIPVCFVMEFKDHHVDYRKMRENQPGVHISEKQKTAECGGCAIRASCPGPRKDYLAVYEAL